MECMSLMQRNPGHGGAAFVLLRPFVFHFEHTLPLKRANQANVTFDRLDVLVDQDGHPFPIMSKNS